MGKVLLCSIDADLLSLFHRAQIIELLSSTDIYICTPYVAGITSSFFFFSFFFFDLPLTTDMYFNKAISCSCGKKEKKEKVRTVTGATTARICVEEIITCACIDIDTSTYMYNTSVCTVKKSVQIQYYIPFWTDYASPAPGRYTFREKAVAHANCQLPNDPFSHSTLL